MNGNRRTQDERLSSRTVVLTYSSWYFEGIYVTSYHMSGLIPLLPLFFAASVLYSSVGHGGASAYLAILVLAGYPRQDVAPTVLVLNILVALIGSVNYFRAGHFKI